MEVPYNPSFGYELKRDFVRGYDRTWQFVIDSVANQTETYANSFYSRVAGEQAIQVLNGLKIQDKNPELHFYRKMSDSRGNIHFKSY